jgi:hypothetical protein
MRRAGVAHSGQGALVGSAHAQGDLGRGVIDLARLEAQHGRIG